MASSRPSVRFKTIIPKKGFLFDVFQEEITKVMRNEVKPELRTQFYSTVSGWEHKVYFRGTIRSVPGRFIRLLVKPYGSGTELYELVARGARPHDIVPVSAKALSFLDGYDAATEPRWIGSRRKRRFGNRVFTQIVHHPGFEGREWDIEIAEKYADRFEYLMRKAVASYQRIQQREFKNLQRTETPRKVERK